MMPPPTPVPSVTIIRFLYPAPPPFHISPRAATLASFPTSTSSPVSSSSSFFTSLYFQPRFALPKTIPSSVTGAGTPTPTPIISASARSCSAFFSLSDAATSGRIAFPSSSVWVLISHFSKIVPVASNKPIFTVVPPISTPKQYFIFLLSYFLFVKLF